MESKQGEALRQAVHSAAQNSWSEFERSGGAAVMTEGGQIFLGCLVESGTPGSGICAIRAAISAAVVAGSRRIARVTATPCDSRFDTVCGHCRQMMFEHAVADFVLDLIGRGEWGAEDLFPDQPVILARSDEEVFENTSVGIAHMSLDGRWLRVNSKVCEITGYPYKELIRLSFQEITHPDDLEADMANVKRLLDGAIRDYSMEKRYIRKDGEVVWVDLHVTLTRKDGIPDFFVSTIQESYAHKVLIA